MRKRPRERTKGGDKLGVLEAGKAGSCRDKECGLNSKSEEKPLESVKI